MLLEDIEIWASLQPMFFLHNGHVGSAAGSSKWAYALRSGVCPDRRRARGTASALLEVTMQSAFQEKCSYTMAVRGLLDGGSTMMRQMWALRLIRKSVCLILHLNSGEASSAARSSGAVARANRLSSHQKLCLSNSP